jgi:hypothetical protein
MAEKKLTARELMRRQGEGAAAWLARLRGIGVPAYKPLRAPYRTYLAKAERQARLEAGKRPLKPRTVDERMVATAEEGGTSEGVGGKRSRSGVTWRRFAWTM